ncbi:MAG: mucoidy inhibitor MuiA family protein, partial [Archangium sp.]|nr:mucoidy inhibitor MuiA family protein [Archangium sp.]
MTALSSKLDAVTVFREGALCRRLATVAPSKERQVRLGGLPLSLDPSSFRAKVISGSGKVVDVRAQFDVEFVDEADVPQEQKALEAAAALVAKLELERQRLNNEITELQALKPSFLEHKRGEPPRAAPVESMLALGEFTEASLSKRLERRRKLDRELQDAREDQQLRLRRLAEATAAKRTERSRLWRVAVVTLAEAPAEPLGLELEYRVPGARWAPAYALTLDKGLGNGTLQMRASIAQNTGEDWSQVTLSLSTASASRRADMPELKSLKIGRRQEAPPRSGWREPPPGLESLFEAFDQSSINDRLGGLNGAPATTTETSTRVGGYTGDLKTITGFAAGAAGIVPPPQKAQRPTGSFAPPPAPPPPPRNAPMPVAAASAPMPSIRSADKSAGAMAAPAAPGGGGRASYQAIPQMQAAPKSGGAFGRLRGAMKKDMAYDDDEREEAPAAEMSLDEGGHFGGDADGIDNL